MCVRIYYILPQADGGQGAVAKQPRLPASQEEAGAARRGGRAGGQGGGAKGGAEAGGGRREEAMRWLDEAACLGSAPAMFNRALLHRAAGAYIQLILERGGAGIQLIDIERTLHRSLREGA
jgi:hypothetical protein